MSSFRASRQFPAETRVLRIRTGTAVPRALLLAAILFAVMAQPAFAQEMNAARKVGRGLAGMTLGVMEIPGNMVQEGRTNGAVSGMTIGFGIGVGKFVTRTLIGVYEFVTAPFPLPAYFEPVLAPEFPWQYFESEPGRVYGFGNSYLNEEAAELERIPGAVVERRQGALTVRFPSDLLFSIDSAKLGAAAKSRLRGVAATLQRHPDTQIEILGFTDSTGSESHNQQLSNARADAVYRYLASQGVRAERLGSAGYGSTGALASNQTADGRRLNRRVELQVRASGVGAYR